MIVQYGRKSGKRARIEPDPTHDATASISISDNGLHTLPTLLDHSPSILFLNTSTIKNNFTKYRDLIFCCQYLFKYDFQFHPVSVGVGVRLTSVWPKPVQTLLISHLYTWPRCYRAKCDRVYVVIFPIVAHPDLSVQGCDCKLNEFGRTVKITC